MRRILIALALLVVLPWASGNASDPNGGLFVKKVPINLFRIDTANYLDGAAALVNDSLSFYSQPFGISKDWTAGRIELFLVSADTVFAADTIGLQLQTKNDTQYDTSWSPVGSMTKKAEGTIMSVPLTSVLRTYNDADSVFIADLYRIKLTIVAEEDSIRGHDQTGILPLNAQYLVYCIFRHRGNE